MRNYHIPNYDPQNVYFEFENQPTPEMIEFVKEYAKSVGGTAEFSDGDKRFIILKELLA